MCCNGFSFQNVVLAFVIIDTYIGNRYGTTEKNALFLLKNQLTLTGLG